MAKKPTQELDAIRRAFGRPVMASPPGLKSSGLEMSLTPQKRKLFEKRLAAAQARATHALARG